MRRIWMGGKKIMLMRTIWTETRSGVYVLQLVRFSTHPIQQVCTKSFK